MSEKVTLPIRLILGMPDVDVTGGIGETGTAIMLCYERKNGSAGTAWISTDEFCAKTKFVDAPEQSCIVWREVEEKAGFFGNKTETKLEIIEIHLRRDWQFKS